MRWTWAWWTDVLVSVLQDVRWLAVEGKRGASDNVFATCFSSSRTPYENSLSSFWHLLHMVSGLIRPLVPPISAFQMDLLPPSPAPNLGCLYTLDFDLIAVLKPILQQWSGMVITSFKWLDLKHIPLLVINVLCHAGSADCFNKGVSPLKASLISLIRYWIIGLNSQKRLPYLHDSFGLGIGL